MCMLIKESTFSLLMVGTNFHVDHCGLLASHTQLFMKRAKYERVKEHLCCLNTGALP